MKANTLLDFSDAPIPVVEEVGASFSVFVTWLRLENLRIQLENELPAAEHATRKRL